MFTRSVEANFLRWRETAQPEALARVFDATAPELTKLARHLAGPEASAEDLLQATFLTAIEFRARFDADQRLLPWLVGILVNHARDSRRRGRREIDPERLLHEPFADPADDAARTELEESLADAIAKQPEAYRAVLRLYLQHGLEPAEIAASLERPPGTVRAQLSRGLERLRRALPASLSSSRALAVAPSLASLRERILARAGDVAPAASAVLPKSGLLAIAMSKKSLLAAAVLLLVCLPIALRFAVDASPPTPPSEPSVAATPMESTAAATTETVAVDAAGDARSTPDAVAASPSAGVAPRRTASLTVRVETSAGQAIAGVAVALRTVDQLQDLGTMLNFRRTNEDGEVTLEDLAPDRYVIELDRSGSRDFVLLDAGERKHQIVRLSGARVLGRVVDEHGSPLAGATILAHNERLESVVVATSDARGNFEVLAVSSSSALQARLAGHVASKAHRVTGKEGEDWPVEFVLHGDAGEIVGRVFDRHGAPLPNALISFVPAHSRFLTPWDGDDPQVRAVQVRSGGDGSFRCIELPRGTSVVTASGGDAESAPASVEVEVSSAPQRVELRLPTGATIEGRITDGGRPVRDASVFVFTSSPETPSSYLFNLLASRNATTDSDGRFRCSGILPGTVELRALRNGLETITQQTMTLGSGERRTFDFDCGAKPTVALDVVLEPWPLPNTQGPVLVNATLLGGEATELSLQVVDATGHARFANAPDGRLALTVFRHSVPGDLVTLVTAEVDAREGRVVLRVPPERLSSQSLRGRLVDESGAAVARRSLRLSFSEGGAPVTMMRTSGEDGSFEFTGLPAGRYVLVELIEQQPRALREVVVSADRPEDLGALVVH